MCISNYGPVGEKPSKKMADRMLVPMTVSESMNRFVWLKFRLKGNVGGWAAVVQCSHDYIWGRE